MAALTPRAELEGDMGDTHVGLQARLMSQALKINGSISKSNTMVIFINQIRMKIGVMFGVQKQQQVEMHLNSIPLLEWILEELVP